MSSVLEGLRGDPQAYGAYLDRLNSAMVNPAEKRVEPLGPFGVHGPLPSFLRKNGFTITGGDRQISGRSFVLRSRVFIEGREGQTPEDLAIQVEVSTGVLGTSHPKPSYADHQERPQIAVTIPTGWKPPAENHDLFVFDR